MSYLANVSKIASKSLHTCTSGHAKRQASRPDFKPFSFLDFKNMFRFRPLLSPIFPRLDKTKQINVYFCPVFDLFGMETCHDGRQPDSGRQNGSPFAICREDIKEGTPPPICGAPSAFYPHNFSHQKYRKKSPWSDWKKFRKKFAGKCFGVRESPQSCRKGARGAKI